MSTQSYHEGAYMALMRGLRELDFKVPYDPSDLVLTGDHAFPLAMNSQGQVLMAASLYGRGRIVVLGHEGYLTAFPALVENALTWLRGDGSANLSVGVHNSVKAVADNLSKSSLQAKVVGAFSNNLGVGVYVTDAYSVGADAKDLVAFLKAGGGVLIGGQAWHWAGNHPQENRLLQFPGNKVSGVAGIYFSEHYVKVEILPVPPQIPSSWMTLNVGKDFKDDLEFLLQKVSKFDLQGGDPSEVLVHGPLAFPIGTTEDGQTFLAGAYHGLGRVIVVAHEAFLGEKTLASFWNNAIDWLDQSRKGVVGVAPKLHLTSSSGLKCEKTQFRKDLSVFVCKGYSDDHMEEIQDFVSEGGGLLIGGQAWYWTYNHRGQNPLIGFPGNRILNKMGLSLLDTTIEKGSYKANVPDKTKKDTLHFRHFLRQFAGHVTQGDRLTKREEEHLEKLGAECASFLSMKAYDSYYYTQVLSILTDMFKKFMPQVSEEKPVKSPKEHLLLSLGRQLYNFTPAPDALLPYLIKDNPTMPPVYNERIKIDVNTAGEEEWISTGLYLSPGMKTDMIIPAEIVNKECKIQIGCQTDTLEHKELKRAAIVCEQFPITAEKMEVWNLWGGLIYLVAPPNTKVEGAEIIVQKAIRAPYYKSGETRDADWMLLRKAPSPWAELEFDNIILSLPSHAVRDLERPREVAALWNDIMKSVAELGALPHKFARKERIVVDVQISFGYMHSGYPIMMDSSVAADLINPDDARTKGLWGQIHELGHNQQRTHWDFEPHTAEATCNLWSVYVHEEVLGINRAQAHSSMTSAQQRSRAEEYVKGGKKLSDWTEWVALDTYMQLQEKFGWDAFKKVFAAYHRMSDFPDDNKGKMNLYAETFSHAVGMNLAAFFKAWGWPIGRDTEEKLFSLPPWTDHPMVRYD
ncbi:TRPM8 channel-associated factor homolog [Chelmon rostratus]|uniref:TRPM8 channel-associated factor homolog n=1 Tax=Chelmon rostratus TaxID=109905 RepID=UPI001BED3A28|nr:TRPM8 channel-associated factor homolog [Chelmon rostratus]